MKHTIAASTLAAVLALGCQPAPLVAPPQGPAPGAVMGCGVRGRLVDGHGQPRVFAGIFTVSRDARPRATVRSDHEGRFALPGDCQRLLAVASETADGIAAGLDWVEDAAVDLELPMPRTGDLLTVRALDEDDAARQRVLELIAFNLRNRYNGSGALGALIAVLYILIVCTVSIFSAAGGQKVSVQRQTVAVLGFRASDVNDEALGTGIRDTLRARIGNLKEITLRPEGPSVTQNGILTVGREAKAEIVFTGSIQHIEDRVRVAVEMVDVEHERVVWGKTFDYNGPDRFFVHDAIADEVLKVLGRTRSDVAAGRL